MAYDITFLLSPRISLLLDGLRTFPIDMNRQVFWDGLPGNALQCVLYAVSLFCICIFLSNVGQSDIGSTYKRIL